MLARSVFVTGANRGLGLEMVKQLLKDEKPPTVLFGACRSPDTATELQHLAKQNSNLKLVEIDVKDHNSFASVVDEVARTVGQDGLNLLINNAGVLRHAPNFESITAELMEENFAVNTIGPIKLIQAFLPLIKQAAVANSSMSVSVARAGIVNMSSVLGSLTLAPSLRDGKRNVIPYNCSKVALNMVTRCLGAELKAKKVLITSLHPGWVKTDMGGPQAPLTVKDSVSGLIRTMKGLGEKHHSNFYQWDGKELPW